MAFQTIPEISQWAKEENKFTIMFKAFDNYGNLCTGDNISIQFNMTYDETIPNLNNSTEKKGDTNGLIFLDINKPCRITIYGKFACDVDDSSKGFITQQIAIDYNIDFKPCIVSINGEYKGNPVPITDMFDLSNIQVKAKMSNGTIKKIDIKDCTLVSNQYIEYILNNIKTFQYYDNQLKYTWQFDVDIPGKNKLLSLEAKYTGTIKTEGDKVYRSELIVTLQYQDESGVHLKQLEDNEYEFTSMPMVIYMNDGIIGIRYETVDTTIKIPFIEDTELHINAWYEGFDIQINNSYSVNDVVVMLIIPNGDQKRLNVIDLQFSNTLVEKEGWNWYTVTYQNNFKTYKQKFAVKGYIPNYSPDLDFKVVYIDENNQEIDYTDKFKEAFNLEGNMIITWKNFLIEVNELMLYGLYRLTAPKRTGLSNKYDQEWEVLCIDKNTLRSHVLKTYL